MKLKLAWIGRTKNKAVQELRDDYLKRTGRYIPIDGQEFASEEALLKSLSKPQRTPPILVVLDRCGKQLSSEQIAELLRDFRDGGTQELLFAIGPADGWTNTALDAAHFQLSFGPITLPHELARVVLAEQLYRAFTILQGHPYHCGH